MFKIILTNPGRCVYENAEYLQGESRELVTTLLFSSVDGPLPTFQGDRIYASTPTIYHQLHSPSPKVFCRIIHANLRVARPILNRPLVMYLSRLLCHESAHESPSTLPPKITKMAHRDRPMRGCQGQAHSAKRIRPVLAYWSSG